MKSTKILSSEFYERPNVITIAKDLVGKIIFSCINQEVTAGIITETEAYHGIQDRASHAYGERRTSRTEVMYQAGGVAYIYLCYGIHHLLNIVTGPADVPHAVLIRALQPYQGLHSMQKRRQGKELLCSGPSVAVMFNPKV